MVGVGVNTEEGCGEGNEVMVVYRPLYEDSPVFMSGKLSWLRPLSMWNEKVTKAEGNPPRFRKITDDRVIAELREIKPKMYP